MTGPAAMPRRNGELVFAEPWQGRVFGMAVALSERGPSRGGLPPGADRPGRRRGAARRALRVLRVWLATFERLLAAKGLVSGAEVEECAFQFEFGERDEVF